MENYKFDKSILNAPKHKFLIPKVKPSPFSLDENDNKSFEEEINISELYMSSDSSISSDIEEENVYMNKKISVDNSEIKCRPKLSGSSLDTKGTD